MNFVVESSSSTCNSKKEFKEEEDGEKTINIQHEEDVIIECLGTGSNFDNAFVDVSKTSQDLENELMNEVHSFFPSDDPLSTETDKHNGKDIEEETAKNIRQSNIDFNNDVISKPRSRLSFCTFNCHLKVTEEDQKRIFNTFWGKLSFHSRFRFVNDITEIKLKRDGMRKRTKFYLDTDNGRQSVCRLCFLTVLGISRGFLNVLLAQKICKRGDSRSQQIVRSETKDQILMEKKLLKGWTRISPCSMNCYSRVTEEDQKRIFESYWQGATTDSRYKFIYDMIETEPINFAAGNKRFHTTCYLNTDEGSQHVCRKCFRIVLGEAHNFLESAFAKKRYEMKIMSKIDDLTRISLSEKSVDPNLVLKQGEISTLKRKLKMIETQDSSDFETNDVDDDVDLEVKKAEGLSTKIPKQISDFETKYIKNECSTAGFNVTNNFVDVSKTLAEKSINEAPSLLSNDDLSTKMVGQERSHQIMDISALKMEKDGQTSLITQCEEETPDSENELVNEAHSLLSNDDLISQEIDKPDRKNIEEMTAKDSGQSLNSVSNYIGTNYRMRQLSCGYNCHLKVTEEDQRRIFQTFWHTGTFNSRVSFVNDMTEFRKKQIGYMRYVKGANHCQSNFYFNTDKGRQRVCRLCFLSVLDISTRFLDVALDHKLRKMKRLNKTNKKDLRSRNLKVDSANSSCEKLDVLEVQENSKDKLTNETNSFPKGDSFSQKNLGSELKNKIEKQDQILRENKLLHGWSRIHPCRNNCHLRVTEEDQKRIFESYWRGATSDSRYRFICDMVETLPIRYLHGNKRIACYLNTDKGSQQVCKLCFRKAINEPLKYIDEVLDKKRSEIEASGKNKESAGIGVTSSSPLARKLKEIKNQENGDYENNLDFEDEEDTDDMKNKYFTKGSNLDFDDESPTSSEEESVSGAPFLLSNDDFSRKTVGKEEDKSTFVDVSKVCSESELIHKNHSLLDDEPPSSNIANENPIIIPQNFKSLNSKKVSQGWTRLPMCNRFCHLKITEQDQKRIFESYWQGATIDSRYKFVCDMTESMPVKNSVIYHKRFFSYFYLNTAKSVQKVCKTCFRIAINESSSFILKALDQKWKDVCESDANSKEIQKKENSNLESDDPDLEGEEDEEFPKKVSDLETKDIEIECSTTRFNLNNDLDDESETLQSSGKEAVNETPSLFPKVDLIPTKIDDITCPSCTSLKESQLGKSWTRLPSCVKKCHLKVKENDQEQIFNSYWQEETFNSRLNFVNDMAELEPESDPANNTGILRYVTRFYLNTDKGRQKVCKSCFRLVLDVSDAFIAAVLNQKLYKVKMLNASREDNLRTNAKHSFVDEDTLSPKTVEINNKNICQSCNSLANIKIKQSWTPLTPCKRQCHLKVSENDQNRIFHYYWQGITVDSRQRFVCDMTESKTVEFLSKVTPKIQPEGFVTSYYLHTENGVQTVCKFCFCTVINESLKFMDNTLENKWNKIKVMSQLKNEEPKSPSQKECLSQDDGQLNLDLKQERIQEKEITYPLKRKLSEIEKQEDSDVPSDTLFIKEVNLENNDLEIKEDEDKEPPKKALKNFSDPKTKDMESENSARFNLVNDCIRESEALHSSVERAVSPENFSKKSNEGKDQVGKLNESMEENLGIDESHLILDDDPLSPEIIDSNQGLNSLEYKKIKDRRIRLLPCKNGCHLKITPKDQKRIFNSYCERETENCRERFICDLIEIEPLSGDLQNYKIKFQSNFYFNTSEGVQKVCKFCFCLILNETFQFINRVLEKKWNENKVMERFMIEKKDVGLNFVLDQEETSSSLRKSKLREIKSDDPEVIVIEDDESSERLPKKISNVETKVIGIESDDLVGDDVGLNFVLDQEETSSSLRKSKLREIKSDDPEVIVIEDDESSERLPKKISNVETKVIDIESDDLFSTKVLDSLENYQQRKSWTRLRPCISKCHLRIKEKDQERIFNSFWQEGTFESRFNFVMDMTEFSPWSEDFRECKKLYLHTDAGRERVCRQCFRIILDISNAFIEAVLYKKLLKVNKPNEANEMMNETLTNDVPLSPKIIEPNPTGHISLSKNNVDSNFISDREEETTFLPWEKKLYKIAKEKNSNLPIETSIIKEEVDLGNGSEVPEEEIEKPGKIPEEISDFESKGIKIECTSDFHLADNFVDVSERLQSLEEKSISAASSLISNDDPLAIKTINQETQQLYQKRDWIRLAPCYNECHLKIQEKDQERIFNMFWNLRTSRARFSFLMDMIEIINSQVMMNGHLRKIYDLTFHLNTDNGRQKVCRFCFRKTLGLMDTFISLVTEKKLLAIYNLEDTKDLIKLDHDSAQILRNKTLKGELVKATDIPFANGNSDSPKLKKQDVKFKRGWTQLSPCVNNCHMKIKEKEQEQIFYSYWQEGTYDSRFSFVSNMTEMIPKEQSNLKKGYQGRKIYDTKFHLNTESGRQTVCRFCFRHILGEWNSFITIVLEKKLTAIYKLDDDKERILQAQKKVDSVIAQILRDKKSKGELNKATNVLFVNDNPHSLKIIVPEVKIPSENKVPSLTVEKSPEKNSQDQVQKGKRKYTRNKEALSNGDPFSSKVVGKKSKGRVKNQACNIPTNNNPVKDSTRLLPIKSKVPKSCNKISQEERLSKRMEMLINKYCKKTQSDGPVEKDKDQISNLLINNKVRSDTTTLFSYENHVLKPTNEETKTVEEHIKKFPVCESYHYNGQSSEKYLPMGLTTKIMYDLYKNEVSNPVSIVWYQKILEQTDMKFKLSFLTKCDECNTAALQYRLSKDPSEKSKINSHRSAHLIDSEEANNAKVQDENTTNTVNSVMVCSFGFQQSLPTPFLDIPAAYYKQRLWTYNFTVQRSGENHVGKHRQFYMWHEAQGKRSANEIASCLYEFLQKLPPKIKFVIFYSTSCNGESRSKTLAAMFSHLVANHKTLATIEHKFLISGHSQIEENLGDNLAEEIMKHHKGRIQQPKDWYEAFDKHLQLTDESEVTLMGPEMFYDFESLRQDVFEGSEPFIEKEVKWLRYTKNGVYYKKSYSATDQFQILNLNGPSESKEFSKRKLRNHGSVSITEEKKNDLLDLRPFMKSEVKSFYEGLPLEKDLPRKDTSQNFCVNSEVQEECKILSSPLKRKFGEIGKQENNDLPKKSIIKQNVVLEEANPKVRKEDLPKKTPKKSSAEINPEFELIIVKEERIDKCQ